MWLLPQQENFNRKFCSFLAVLEAFSPSKSKWKWVGGNDTEKRLGMVAGGVLNSKESEGQERQSLEFSPISDNLPAVVLIKLPSCFLPQILL